MNLRTIFATTYLGFYFYWQFSPIVMACPCQQIKPLTEAPAIDRAAGIKFTYSAAYKKEFSSAIEQAYTACKQHLGEKDIAIVSDIDETLLDNREGLSSMKEFKYELFIDWINQAKSPVLSPTAQFIKWAREHGFATFLVTGRKEAERRATIENLLKAGIAYDGLYMRPNGDSEPAGELKSAIRQSIENMGFKIIVNIGDQNSDLTGGYALDCEKLPNKIYFVP